MQGQLIVNLRHNCCVQRAMRVEQTFDTGSVDHLLIGFKSLLKQLIKIHEEPGN